MQLWLPRLSVTLWPDGDGAVVPSSRRVAVRVTGLPWAMTNGPVSVVVVSSRVTVIEHRVGDGDVVTVGHGDRGGIDAGRHREGPGHGRGAITVVRQHEA